MFQEIRNRKEVNTMRVIKKETIHLSPNELDTLMKAIQIFEGVKRAASMPSVLTGCEACTECLSDFLAIHCEVDADILHPEQYPNDLL
jgi:hypothetical protein